LSVRPGITDLASLEFSDESSLLARAEDPQRFYLEEVLPMKIKYYREYVGTRTLIGDVRIILATLQKVFLGGER
jgi:lipopolysaccharide/colanic/teichoic acid biosynthesis glycosyltransferase